MDKAYKLKKSENGNHQKYEISYVVNNQLNKINP